MLDGKRSLFEFTFKTNSDLKYNVELSGFDIFQVFKISMN